MCSMWGDEQNKLIFSGHYAESAGRQRANITLH